MVELSIASNLALSIFGTLDSVSMRSRPTLPLAGVFPAITSSMYLRICVRHLSIVSAALGGVGREKWRGRGREEGEVEGEGGGRSGGGGRREKWRGREEGEVYKIEERRERKDK